MKIVKKNIYKVKSHIHGEKSQGKEGKVVECQK